MKKEIKAIIILFIGFLVEWWLFVFSGLNLPTYIANTPINIEGLLLLVLLAVVLILFIKKLFKICNPLPIWKSTLAGGLVCFVAEIGFQFIRQLSIHNEALQERLYHFFTGTFVMAIFAATISFFIAFLMPNQTKR